MVAGAFNQVKIPVRSATTVLQHRFQGSHLVCRLPNSHGSFDFEETGRVVLGDIRGTRKRCLGMAGKLLTDARETSYWI